MRRGYIRAGIDKINQVSTEQHSLQVEDESKFVEMRKELESLKSTIQTMEQKQQKDSDAKPKPENMTMSL